MIKTLYNKLQDVQKVLLFRRMFSLGDGEPVVDDHFQKIGSYGGNNGRIESNYRG